MLDGIAAFEIAIHAGAGGKQAIGNGLGVEIGKLLRGKTGNEVFLEGLIVTEKLSALGFRLPELLSHNLIAQETGTFGKGNSERLGSEVDRKFKVEEELDKFLKDLWIFKGGSGFEFLSGEMTGNAGLMVKLAIAEEAKFVKIGEDKVGEGSEVTLKLFGSFDLIQIGAGPFGFDVTHNEMVAIPNAEVRVAGFGGFGQDGDVGFAVFGEGDGFQKGFKGGVVGFFAGITSGGDVGDRFEVLGESLLHAGPCSVR